MECYIIPSLQGFCPQNHNSNKSFITFFPTYKDSVPRIEDTY